MGGSVKSAHFCYTVFNMNDLPIYDVLIIGAGASGLLCALECARARKSVLILEKDPLPGRKILASGNGRCNLTNAQVSPDFYHAPRELIESALKQFPFAACKKYFEDLGVLLVEEDNGRFFPATGKATAVLEPLKLAALENGAELKTGQEVVKIKRGKTFTVQTQQGGHFQARNLVLACGSCAFPQLTGTQSGYALAKSLGHSIISPAPALCALTVKEKAISRLQGLRAQVALTASAGQEILAQSQGEVLFTNYGLSGPAAINISAAITRRLPQGNVSVELNFFPGRTDFAAFMQARREKFGHRKAKDFFAGLLHENIANLLIDFAGIKKNISVKEWTPNTWNNVLKTLTGWAFTVCAARPWTEAMAATGGVNCREINYNTFESLKCAGLFITGELLDVDGRSGGFNLHFAWSSGFAAAQKLVEA